MKNNKGNKGFALLISVIFMSVMLTFGLALSSLGYKQSVLASSALESQYAFYTADAALECALYADQQLGTFDYPASDPGGAPTMECGGRPAIASDDWSITRWIVSSRLQLSTDSCADVKVYKYKNPDPITHISTYIYSQGYSVSCETVSAPGGARFASRGLNIYY